MGGGHGHGPQLVQGQDGGPIFVVPFEHQHHPVALVHPGPPQGVGRPVAQLSQLPVGEAALFPGHVAPDQGLAIRLLGRQHVHHVVGEIEIVRMVDGKPREGAVLVKFLLAEAFVQLHIHAQPF